MIKLSKGQYLSHSSPYLNKDLHDDGSLKTIWNKKKSKKNILFSFVSNNEWKINNQSYRFATILTVYSAVKTTIILSEKIWNKFRNIFHEKFSRIISKYNLIFSRWSRLTLIGSLDGIAWNDPDGASELFPASMFFLEEIHFLWTAK